MSTQPQIEKRLDIKTFLRLQIPVINFRAMILIMTLAKETADTIIVGDGFLIYFWGLFLMVLL